MSIFDKPYISFVIAARNDDYGGNFLHRMQLFTDCLLVLGKKRGLNAELVIVEWNPPKDSLRLANALTWPEHLRPDMVRIIEVPQEIHQRLPNSDKMPMFEFIAKNVGIRRARGDYILATNPDLLYSEGLISFLASERLSPECFYRVDRYDIDAVVPPDMQIEEQLRFCSGHILRINRCHGTVPFHPKLSDYVSVKSILPLLLSYKVKLMREKSYKIHTNASGDFFLMAKGYWHELRGYPELPSHSYIDGYICYMAASSGLRQIILDNPNKIYHQPHERAGSATRPRTDYQLYSEHCKEMMKLKHPFVLNDEGWGLGMEQLVEYQIPIGYR